MEKKTASTRTIDQVKKERQVPTMVKEELKQFNRMKRAIRTALEEGPKTIPELAGELDLSPAEVTYYLMSLRKYGVVMTGELDDMDEYYYYQLKK
ncbi:MAG: ArsR family transcriptional regulator [Bacteroidales bacterium]|nr:ArsR family transcriptional regulator [Bacteroidales bacterium]